MNKRVPRDQPKPSNFNFDYGSIPAGFYQEIIETGHPVRRAWHLQKFERVIECLPEGEGLSVLDIGCSAGTFLSRVPARFTTQLGVDIDAKQVAYANQRFATPYRRFEATTDLKNLGQKFDVVTLIEVIEHLTSTQVAELINDIAVVLKPGGHLIMSTPNYLSAWPLLELLVNRVSEVSYEEQHITKLDYFTVTTRLAQLVPDFAKHFALEMKTSTHFAAPYLAAISLPWSMRVSRLVDHKRWFNPFGALVLLSFRRTFS